MGYRSWRPQASVSARRAKARRDTAKLRKQGVELHPVEIEGRKIAKSSGVRRGASILRNSAITQTVCPGGKATCEMVLYLIWK